MKKVLKYLGFGVIAFIALGVIAVASGDSKTDTMPHRIVNTDSSSKQITFRITINNRTNKDSLIEIARQLKSERDWKEKLVCFFDIKVPSNNFAWASCAYLPDCTDCETDKDKDGNPIQFNLIGMTKSLADSLQKRNLDSVENKKLVVSYLEDAWKCKTQLYIVDNDNSKLLMAQLFNDGGKILQWLKLQEVGGQERFYFTDDDERNYIIIDDQKKTVNFYNAKDKLWLSNPTD